MQQMALISIPIEDLGCAASDAPIVERQLARVRGVAEVYMNPATETVYVRFDPAATEPRELARALLEAGFRAGQPVPG